MLSIRPVSRSENGTIHRPKTPGRGLQNENAIRLPPATVLNKGKNVMQTPFQPKSLKPQRLFKEESQAKGSERLAPKPFLDKTPFPNRIALQTNAQTPFGANLSVDTPDSFLRPSSTRKHIRVPRTSLKYETPMNTKNHWDLSDDDMSVPVIEEVPKLLLPEDDYDEVEYMAPNTLDLPYQPPFDFELPNYKDVGKRLLEMAWSGCVDDEFQPPELEPDIKDLDLGSWEGLTLPPLGRMTILSAKSVNPNPLPKLLQSPPPPANPLLPRNSPLPLPLQSRNPNPSLHDLFTLAPNLFLLLPVLLPVLFLVARAVSRLPVQGRRQLSLARLKQSRYVRNL
ncbi:hypothetical protein K435DRAFT_125676 [Dendrothele bispora CBS 962.96]|uniref:Uncharacterized protein n=1 Tax=Dendrothele bispora (strain CBS 962.96) TaxID=1314807 RepID=A0A4S8M0D1_DENBC|nr:hypothetical protein K435DRAFT_125676 [Dendrothele bispora CBS 962.96]